jgi:cytochrome P450 family 6
MARYTTDVIGSCAFGLNVNSIEDPNDNFRVMGRKMLEVDFIQGLKNACIIFTPKVTLCAAKIRVMQTFKCV